MSLVTHPNLRKASVSQYMSNRTKIVDTGSFTRRLRKAFARTGRLFANLYEAIAEARLQKAMIEAELYRNRYVHSSKNDDDLPVVR
jgi:hypothetical protein